MTTWAEFAAAAPTVSEVFLRRHAATGSLCLLGTLRADGSPRISPLEPNIFDGQLVLVGMPGTHKFRDLARDPRFELHTATIDPQLADGDAKVWGEVRNLQDQSFHEGFAADLFERTGLDVRSERFDPFFIADIRGGSAIQVIDQQLQLHIWEPGEGERVVRKD